MKRIRTSVTALLLVAPLTLTACSDDADVGPGDVEVPPVEAPGVEVDPEGEDEGEGSG